MKKAIVYLLIFMGIQMVIGGIIMLLFNLAKLGESYEATKLITTMAVADVVILFVFLYFKWAEVSRHWVRTRPWAVLFWCVLAAFGALIPSSFFQEELLPELPNVVDQEFDLLFNNRLGYFVIGLSGPLVEELVFRGAILRSLLDWRQNPWIGIAISAVFFSLSHMNPAQMPHAFLIGLLLGWMYYRTDSIVPGVVFHWVNNTVAYVLSNIYQNPDMELIELFNGNQRSELLAVFFSLCILIPAILQLNLRMQK